MTTLVTGAAGFIGYYVADALLRRGERVFGLDNLVDYYSVKLKRDRLERLKSHRHFTFEAVDIADRAALAEAVARHGAIRRIVHLAAQAGVRYALENPPAYIDANLLGHANMLEVARRMEGLAHFVYASSSSVYGGRTDAPFAESDRVDRPISLYAATKAAGELLSEAYAHLYAMPQTGLRFFTVYGPWGRPDMAYWRFTEAIFAGRPVSLHNFGDMRRDFTFIDDVVDVVVAAIDRPPPADGATSAHRIYNIGNSRPEPLVRFVDLLEALIGRTVERRLAPADPGEALVTAADVSAVERDFGFRPTTPIDVGLARFVDWYKDYHGL